MSRRTIALLMLVACALALGGWLVVGPALATRTPTAAESPIDLDTAVLGGGRHAASTSSARANTVAPASAASGAADDKARCGEDQAPVYATLEPDADGVIHAPMRVPDADGYPRFMPDEIKAAGVGYTGAMRRIDAALRSSGDPFDTAVADALNVDDVLSSQARLSALVQAAETSRDARVESLAFSACSQATLLHGDGQAPTPGSTICARLNVRQWAQDDPGNGIPWVYALQQADLARDPAAQRDALQHLASATRFDARFGMAAAAVARVRLASDADLAAQTTLAMQAVPLELATSYTSLTSRCRNKAGGNPEMAATCDAIADRMMAHADSLMPLAIGGSIHKLATGDSTRLDKIHRDMAEFGQRWAAQVDAAPCSSERQALRRLVQIGERGEVALARESAR